MCGVVPRRSSKRSFPPSQWSDSGLLIFDFIETLNLPLLSSASTTSATTASLYVWVIVSNVWDNGTSFTDEILVLQGLKNLLDPTCKLPKFGYHWDNSKLSMLFCHAILSTNWSFFRNCRLPDTFLQATVWN